MVMTIWQMRKPRRNTQGHTDKKRWYWKSSPKLLAGVYRSLSSASQTQLLLCSQNPSQERAGPRGLVLAEAANKGLRLFFTLHSTFSCLWLSCHEKETVLMVNTFPALASFNVILNAWCIFTHLILTTLEVDIIFLPVLEIRKIKAQKG